MKLCSALFISASAVLLYAVGAAENKIDPKRAANTVVLDETGVKNLRIETVPVEETDFEETVFALGRIGVMPDKRAVVSARVAGRAHSVLAKPDMKCEAGDELLWVESRQQGDPPPVIRVDAPMSGIIAKVNVAQGQPVGPEDSLMEIYDLSTVEAVAAVPEHLAGKLAKDLAAHIRVPGFPGKVWEAKLAHLGVTADADGGTLEASFHVPNEESLLRPGMRAEFSIVISKREGVLNVPRSALQGEPANRFVYVKRIGLDNAFEKSPVEVGQMNDQSVEIVTGVFIGDEVVTRGAYSLAFAGKGSVSLKEALDAAHGHEHNEDGSEVTPAQKAAGEAAKHGGDDYGHEGDGSLVWKIISGVLLLLLVISSIKRRKPDDSGKDENAGKSKPEPESV